MLGLLKYITISLLVLILIACSVTEPSGTQQQAEVNPDVEKSPELVLTLQQSGGLTGKTSQWNIYSDGRIEATDGNYRQVSPEQVNQLLAEIEVFGFFDLADRYIPLDTCCDRFTYELSVRNEELSHKIVVLESTPEAPDAVWSVLELVQFFLAQAET